ncbi:MAG: hypothetical protein OEX11_04100 [Nitrosomonas sp.]|nr:hypothetical protein [Nitrosomonas sp.]
MVATNYQVDISLHSDTVSLLIDGGYFLYTMFAIEMTNGTARPTIWSRTQNIMGKMTVEWPAAVSAYTSSSNIASGRTIRIGYETKVSNGQIFEVTAGGGGRVKIDGAKLQITVTNTTNTQFTSGFARPYAEEFIPIYAVPLYGNQTNVASVSPQILLLFTTKRLEPGTVVENFVQKPAIQAAYSPSLLVNVTDRETRQVAYDINTGWSWGDYSWAQIIPTNANLVKLLIKS